MLFGNRKHLSVFTLGCLVAGIVFRLAISFRAPVSYDEVFVMGVGLDEAGASARTLFIDVPLRRSNAITPLWWWVQAVPALLTGRLSLWGLRVVPLALGAVTLLVSWRVARRRIGRGPAILFLVFAAVSDVLAFCNARGEFAESLLLLWAIPGVCLVGDRKCTLAKGLLGWLILMTHLGKGLYLVGALAVADAVAQAVRYRTPRALLGPAASLAVAGVPTLGWFILASRLAAAGPLMTDIGPVAGPAEALWKLTAAYAETKRHMVASPWDAAQVWLDGWVWPITALSAVPMLVGTLAAVGRLHTRRSALCLGLLAWIGAGLLVVIGRGMVGARFHLLYLPALWLTASVGLWRLRHLPRAVLMTLGGLWVVSLCAAFSWASWSDRLWHPSNAAFLLAAACAAVLGLGGWVAYRRSSGWHAQDRSVGAERARACQTSPSPDAPTSRAKAASYFSLPLAGCCLTGVFFIPLMLFFGPFRWVPFARMEPYAGREELAALDAYRLGKAALPGPTGRTLYIDLANYFLTKDSRTTSDLQRAEFYARLETERVPDDARAWFYLGETWRELGEPADRVRSAWQRSYELRPTPLLEQRLHDLHEPPPASQPLPSSTRKGKNHESRGD